MPERIAGICWPHAATVGHVTVTSPFIRGTFSARRGSDAITCCDLIAAGKYRNGAARAWCRTHQQYWGTKADLAAAAAHGLQRCARHAEPMHYVLEQLVIDMRAHTSVSIVAVDAELLVQLDGGTPSRHSAIAVLYESVTGLFPAPDIVQINVMPVMVAALSAPQAPGCVCCARCGHPHLDLGGFAAPPHKRHYCGHCGNDSTHSKQAMVSNPLVPLLQHYSRTLHISGSIVQSDNML